jgi:hypothetical protein
MKQSTSGVVGGVKGNQAKKQSIVSPFATAKFAYLDHPDTRFNREKGKYSVHVEMDPENESHAEFLKLIEDIAKAEVGDGATVPITDDKDRDKNYTGLKLVKFASFYPPKLFDMSMEPLDAVVGSGSVIRVSAMVNIYENKGGKSGINLYLKAVQVKELADSFGNDAEAYGFSAGVEVPETPTPPTPKTVEQPSATEAELPF